MTFLYKQEFFHISLSNPWQLQLYQNWSIWSSLCSFRRRQWHATPVLLPGKSHGWRSLVGCSPWGRYEWTRLSDFTFTFHFHAMEKEMATHSGVLAWRIPGTGEPGGLRSTGSHRVGHDWRDLAAAAAVFMYYVWICEAPHYGKITSVMVWG